MEPLAFWEHCVLGVEGRRWVVDKVKIYCIHVWNFQTINKIAPKLSETQPSSNVLSGLSLLSSETALILSLKATACLTVVSMEFDFALRRNCLVAFSWSQHAAPKRNKS